MAEFKIYACAECSACTDEQIEAIKDKSKPTVSQAEYSERIERSASLENEWTMLNTISCKVHGDKYVWLETQFERKINDEFRQGN